MKNDCPFSAVSGDYNAPIYGELNYPPPPQMIIIYLKIAIGFLENKNIGIPYDIEHMVKKFVMIF